MRSTRRLELGGDPPATVASQLCGLPTLFVRKEADVIDREAGGAENLAAEGLELASSFTMSQLR
jgi:orotate phosphoribosyltransferase